MGAPWARSVAGRLKIGFKTGVMTRPSPPRDHGGNLDAAMARFGGARAEWLDLSTGINPVPYPILDLPEEAWTALPDQAAMEQLLEAARAAWAVPEEAEIIAAPGASALIARMPGLVGGSRVHIPGPTYNEHAAAFRASGAEVGEDPAAPVGVYVHPNNPDGRFAPTDALDRHDVTIVDESFCDTCPDRSLVRETVRPGVILLKSFGKFWGLAGLRLGFAIGHPDTLAPGGRPALAELLGPWAVSGPALALGTRALGDLDWATTTRARLDEEAARLDALMDGAGAKLVGGTSLFRTYDVPDAAASQADLARAQIWSRIFPYSKTWLRLGLPAPDRWPQLEAALRGLGQDVAAP